MIIRNLIEELQQKEIEISFFAGKLKYTGPEENITPELIEKLKKHKGKLIKYFWPKELQNLMPINPEGSKIPLFIVHGDNGNYIISEYLGIDQPVYGFFHPGSEGEGIHFKSVKEIARVYLEALRSVRPSGPYYLIGYSFGGVIAYEMAIQLQNAGQKTPFLVLIDSISPLAIKPIEWGEDIINSVRLKILRPVRRGLKRKIRLLICNFYLLFKKKIPIARRNYYLWIKYSGLTRKYFPDKFKGNILLFRTTGHPSSNKYLGWETLVDEIKLIEIEGKHLDVFIGKERTDLLRTEIEKHLNLVQKLN